MKNNYDRSYERYKQYRGNKYRYEQEQIVFPIAVIVGLATIIAFLKYILIVMPIICALLAVVFIYLKKRLSAEQTIVLSKAEAKAGVTAKINVLYCSQRVSVVFDIPSNVKNGQKFVAKNILFENKKGKKVKKNVHFSIQVLEK